MHRVNAFLLALVIALSIGLVSVMLMPPPPITAEQFAVAEQSAHNKPSNHQTKTLWIPEDSTSFFTFWVALFTAVLAVSTIGLWSQTSKAAKAALRQTDVLIAVESAMPLIVAFKLVHYTHIPGEAVVADPLPPGPIPTNCRILFCVENKGRAPCRMAELCIEKFAGTALPSQPLYTNATPWMLALEKGPIWIRGEDSTIVIGATDVAAITAAYQSAGAFWVYGYFAYRSLLNERIEHKFLARWDLANGFVAENLIGYT